MSDKDKDKDKDNLIKLTEILYKHPYFKNISKLFCLKTCEMQNSDPVFFNYLFKNSRIINVNLILSYIFTDKISSLSKIHDICQLNNFTGKNSSVNLIDYLTYGGYLVSNKMIDRRMKKLSLSEKGWLTLNYLMNVYYEPLSIFDKENIDKIELDEKLYKVYFSNLCDFFLDGNKWELENNYLLDIYQKCAGLAFVARILLDFRENKINIHQPIKLIYFNFLAKELGVSHSHFTNILNIIIEETAIRKIGSEYLITTKFIDDIEKFIANILAFVHYFSFKKI